MSARDRYPIHIRSNSSATPSTVTILPAPGVGRRYVLLGHRGFASGGTAQDIDLRASDGINSSVTLFQTSLPVAAGTAFSAQVADLPEGGHPFAPNQSVSLTCNCPGATLTGFSTEFIVEASSDNPAS